jgi:hypothetical protein
MAKEMRVYLAGCLLALALAAGLAIAHRRRVSLLGREYRRFLLTRWRLVTFAIATTALVVVAPYTGDPTWDYYDASFMAALTFLTAPWALGCLFRGLTGRGRRDPVELYVAACAWMFSTSWSYDLYYSFRFGFYPPSWSSNIAASAILYGSAGLFWNLDWRPGRGVTFSFLEPTWPAASAGGHFGKVLGYATAFMVLVTGSLTYVFLLRGH